MNRKCQSALEYLLTYSWALLIIVIVGAALFALGVFNPAASTALQVRGLSNFHIDDATMNSAGNFTVLLGTRVGRATHVSDIDYDVQGYVCNNTAEDGDWTINPSQTEEISLVAENSCSLTTGSTVIMDTNIVYTAGRSDLEHTDTGTITILVQ